MTSPLSQELFHTVHRGIYLKQDTDKLDTSALGVHWSVNKRVAEGFSKSNSFITSPWSKVIHAEVPMSSVETDTAQMQKRGYASFPGPNNLGEQEVMVKEGAPVKVTGITSYRRSKNDVASRTRRYNPPREMKA